MIFQNMTICMYYVLPRLDVTGMFYVLCVDFEKHYINNEFSL